MRRIRESTHTSLKVGFIHLEQEDWSPLGSMSSVVVIPEHQRSAESSVPIADEEVRFKLDIYVEKW